MLLALSEIIRRSGHSDLEFFQVAYYWRFQKHVDVWGDVLAFRTQGVIPSYVKERVAMLEGNKNGL